MQGLEDHCYRFTRDELNPCFFEVSLKVPAKTTSYKIVLYLVFKRVNNGFAYPFSYRTLFGGR